MCEFPVTEVFPVSATYTPFFFYFSLNATARVCVIQNKMTICLTLYNLYLGTYNWLMDSNNHKENKEYYSMNNSVKIYQLN